MFAPTVQQPTAPQTRHSTRSGGGTNPRRRQRGDNDSISIKQPLRKRSKLSGGTPNNGTDSVLSGSDSNNVSREGSVQRHANGKAKGGQHKEARGTPLSLAVRERRNGTPARDGVGALNGHAGAGRSDTSTALTRTPHYAFKQLPAFPERLRDGTVDDFRVVIAPGASAGRYALALTRKQALVWDYTAPYANPVPRVFAFPRPYKVGEPLPLGALVKSSESDLGLVVVGGKDGKITYWQNIEVADSMAVFGGERHTGAEGSIRLFSGEAVVELVEAQHAGFLARISSGKVAHFTIQDQHGKPEVGVQLLKGEPTGGWGLTSIFKGSWQKADLAAVKTRTSADRKSHVEVLSLTRDATLTEWDVAWDGVQTFRREINVRAALREAMADEEPVSLQRHESFAVLDFAPMTVPIARGDEVATQGAGETAALLTVVVIQGGERKRYALVELLLLDDASVGVGQVIPVSGFDIRISDRDEVKLLLPEPGHTAVLITDAQIIMVSTTPSEGGQPRFQDAISLKRDPASLILASAPEPLNGNQNVANCLLATKRAGVTRLTLDVPREDPLGEELLEAPNHLSARVKFEQAVYFGGLPDNFLDLRTAPAFRCTEDEVEKALLRVSHDILTSACEFVPPVAQSASDQLAFRSARLLDLTKFIGLNYPTISRNVKWQVLWDAEKIAAIQAVWHAYERVLADVRPGQTPLLNATLERAQQKGTLRPNAKIETADVLRQWFVADGRSIGKIVPWTFDAVQTIWQEQILDTDDFVSYVHQAGEIAVRALDTAFTFRQENAAVFGLGDEDLERGLLITGYEGLPEFWTSRHNVANSVRQLTEFAQTLALTISEDSVEAAEKVKPIAAENVAMVEVSCLSHQERTQWLLHHSKDEESIKGGRKWQIELRAEVLPHLLDGLQKIGFAPEGMRLAEQFGALEPLADITLDELRYYDPKGPEAKNLSPEEKVVANEKFRELKTQVQEYFETLGPDWTDAFYRQEVKDKMYAEMLDKNYGAQRDLTDFLHANPVRGRLAWINDISNNNDKEQAAKSLFATAEQSETNAWCQTVELSLAKLTSLALKGTKKTYATEKQAKLAGEIDKALALSRLQQLVYNHIKHTAYEALSADEVPALMMQVYGQRFEAGTEQPVLGELLSTGFSELLGHRVIDATSLIDVLTLMESAQTEVKADDISGKEFLLALQALDASELAGDEKCKDDFESLARLIWKRCYVRDDWAAIIKAAEGKTDTETMQLVSETALFTTLKEGDLLAIWDTTPSFQILPPTAALGALSDPAALASRFSQEDLAASIARENALDDDALQSYITDAGFEAWFASVRRLAQKAAVDDSPAARDAAEAAELAEFVQNGYEEPKFGLRERSVRELIEGDAREESVPTNGGWDDEVEDGFEDDGEGYEVYEGEEDGDVDEDGDVQMG